MRGYAVDEQELGPEFPVLGAVSVWFGVVLVAITAVSRITKPLYTRNTADSIIEALEFILIALILASVLYLGLRANTDFKLAALPLLINVGTMLIVQFVPFSGLWQEINFRRQWHRYNAVIAMVESGQLEANADGIARLPARDRDLSADGVVLVNTADGATHLFFVTERQSLQQFSGYFYSSNDTPPETGSFGGRWQYVARQRPHWFFCASY